LLITTTAQAPSDNCDADPAVIVPSSLKAGGSKASLSAVVPGRTPSSVSTVTLPPRAGTVTGTISSASRPSLIAARPRVGLGGEVILLGPAEAEPLLVPLGRGAHGNAVESADQVASPDPRRAAADLAARSGRPEYEAERSHLNAVGYGVRLDEYAVEYVGSASGSAHDLVGGFLAEHSGGPGILI
jgi:hypothetical protein